MNRSSLQLFGRIALITVLVVLAIWLLRRFLPALAWAAVLAIASWPARQWLIDKGVRRSIAALLLTVLVGALIVGPLLVLAVQMAREAGVIVQGFRDLKENGLSTPEWVSPLPFVGGYVAAWWTAHLSDPEAAKELLGRIESFGLIGWGRIFGRELVGRLVILVFTLLTLFFAYRDGPAIIDQIRTVADRLFGRSGRAPRQGGGCCGSCHGKRSCTRRISRGRCACTCLRDGGSEPSHSIRVCDRPARDSSIRRACRICGRLPHAHRPVPCQCWGYTFLVRVGCRLPC